MDDAKCVFDHILEGTIPAQIVYEDDDICAFRDVNPQAPVHILVIPKQKMTGFNEVHAAETVSMGAYLKGISLVAKKLQLEENGYRVVFNQGRDGQQTVPYIHAHILAGRSLTWPPG